MHLQVSLIGHKSKLVCQHKSENIVNYNADDIGYALYIRIYLIFS